MIELTDNDSESSSDDEETLFIIIIVLVVAAVIMFVAGSVAIVVLCRKKSQAETILRNSFEMQGTDEVRITYKLIENVTIHERLGGGTFGDVSVTSVHHSN